MNVLSLTSIFIITTFVVTSQCLTRYPDYQMRRPIKYFFHLLELKSQYNPLLYSIGKNDNFCSSKLGPFCSITGHKSLKTHNIKILTPQAQTLKNAMENNAKYGYQTYIDIEKSGSGTFLIRSDLTNSFDMILKKNMGPIHQQNMMDDEFEENAA